MRCHRIPAQFRPPRSPLLSPPFSPLLSFVQLPLRPRIGATLVLFPDLLHEVDGDGRGFVIPFATDVGEDAGDLFVAEKAVS